MSDIDRFFREMDRRMNLPDESTSDYLARLAKQSQTRRTPSTENHDSEGSIDAEASTTPVENVSNNENTAAESGPDRATTSNATPARDDTTSDTTKYDQRDSLRSELITEISSKRKADAGELTSSERDDKRVKLSAQHTRFTEGGHGPVAQTPSTQQRGSSSRREQTELENATLKFKSKDQPTRNTPQHEPSRRVVSKESLRNVPEPGPSKQIENKTTSHSNARKPTAATAVRKSTSKEPEEASKSLKNQPATKPSKPIPQKQTGKKASKETPTSQYLPRNDYKKSPSMSIADYIKRIEGRIRIEQKHLAGNHIYFFGGDRGNATEGTKAKLCKLARCSATLVPAFDPEIVTHIVIDEKFVNPSSLLNRLNLRRLDQVPAHIPILKWEWAVHDNRGRSYVPFGAFADRRNSVDAIGYDPKLNPITPPTMQSKEKETAKEHEFLANHNSSTSRQRKTLSKSRDLEDRTGSSSDEDVRPSKAEERPATGKGLNASDDPLAEFYSQARAEKNNARNRWDLGDENGETTFTEETGKLGDHRPKYLCDGATKSVSQCPNQDVIDKLSELQKIHRQGKMQGDTFRVFKYNQAINSLRTYPKRIRTMEEAKSLNGVGEKTAQKILEIIKTGDLQRLHHARTEDVAVVELFQGIYGVGSNVAHMWYNAGCRTLDDLRESKNGVHLSEIQKIGLEYYDDINLRMPRAEAEAIFNKIKPIALNIDPKLYVDIMGSFRRGKATCGDIDIIITRPTDDGRNHSGVLRKLLKALRIEGIITEDLSLPNSWTDLELCYRGLCQKDPESHHRRIDFLTVPWESRGAALLYYTGDDIFNRSMRLKARKMGYSLNQKGLFAGVVRDPRDRSVKLCDGTNIASATEREIFDVLGVPWQEPHERVRG